MSPPVLFLKDIHLNFGGTPLLKGADLQIMPRDRLCLVGRNGSGKSSMLKIAAGLLEADKGERFQQPGTTLRYLGQEPDVSGYATILDFVESDLSQADSSARAKYLLEELGLDGSEDPANLSGGELRRAAIARALAPQPDILMLDEPTNHLDLPAIEWLEKELTQTRSALVLISHDRRFLDKLTRKTAWIDNGVCRHLNKGFSSFEEWRDKTLDEEEEAAHKLGRKIVREEHWITHGVSGRRKRNMRRVRELADLREEKRNENTARPDLKISSAETDKSGKLVAKLDKVSKRYHSKNIISDFSAIIRRGERIGIVGANGSGKTTLVNLITGKTAPDSGTIKLGVNLETLVIDQKRETLDPDWTLKQALTDDAGDTIVIGSQTKHVMSYMKDFLFLPEQARTPVHALSGGERGRLMLARGLRTPSNFLVLDEPTNDLDLETLDLLQEFLDEYEGTVLLVSHDRDFLDRICTSIIAADGNGQWHLYAGGYSDMMAQKASLHSAPKAAPKPQSQKQAKPEATHKKDAADRLSFKQKHALETLPAGINRLEFEITRLKQALDAPDLYNSDNTKFSKLADALSERESQLAEKEEEWLGLEMLREELEL